MPRACWFILYLTHFSLNFKVARYRFSGPIPPKFEDKLHRYKQSFGKIVNNLETKRSYKRKVNLKNPKFLKQSIKRFKNYSLIC